MVERPFADLKRPSDLDSVQQPFEEACFMRRYEQFRIDPYWNHDMAHA